MRKKSWLLFVVTLVLLAVYALNRSPIPAPVRGVEAPAPTPESVPLVWLPPPTVEDVTPAPVAVADKDAVAEQDEIDAYAAQERQKIEAWYSDQLAILKTQLEQKLQKLDGADKLAWAQFYQRANETWSETSGHGYSLIPGYDSRSETTRTFVKGNPAGEYAAILSRIKESKQVTQQDFVRAQEKLVWMREQKLAAVQVEVNRRKSRAQTETARKLSGDQTPIVEAVVATADNRLCALIGDTLVYEGSMVKGYRVRKINADSVEFEKDGKVWVQRVQ